MSGQYFEYEYWTDYMENRDWVEVERDLSRRYSDIPEAMQSAEPEMVIQDAELNGAGEGTPEGIHLPFEDESDDPLSDLFESIILLE